MDSCADGLKPFASIVSARPYCARYSCCNVALRQTSRARLKKYINKHRAWYLLCKLHLPFPF